ncbi:MAG TPA: DUF2268 domain-containing putative Zn-dependent protease [Candidatus Kapabacteria bacterium]|nr:DUF2268 domain-containing putative Zn-dependent protease [Candidatus Kapabacteria bacterium]
MNIVDLTPDYISFLAGNISIEEYHSANVAFFDQYRKYWGGNDNVGVTHTSEEVESRRALLLRHLATAAERLRANGFSTEHIRAVLFVGSGTANGHAFLDNDGAVAWFALECFQSEFEAKVFTMHELIHALHYAARPEFFFYNIAEQRSVSRQLITEGIATYLTKRLWNLTDEESLWADALPPKQLHSWMNQCRDSELELFELVAENFESSDPSIALFYAANPVDIFSYRAGYYVGMKVIESIAADHNFSDNDLLNIPLSEMKRLASEFIERQKLSWN